MTTQSRSPLSLGSSLRFAFLLYHKLRVNAYRARDQISTIIKSTDPRISYLPSVCDNTGTTPSSTCTAPWQVVALADATTGTVTSTFGPTVAGGNLIPQLFLILRGTSFILTTSSVSNATANVTVSASPSNVFVSTAFDSSAGSLSTINLPLDQDITLAITYVQSPDGKPRRLDIDSVTVTSPDTSHTSLTPIPLPSSSSLPAFVIPAPSPSATTSRPHSSLTQSKGTIVAESLAAFFGLLLILISVYILYRWRRRNLESADVREMRMRDMGKGTATES